MAYDNIDLLHVGVLICQLTLGWELHDIAQALQVLLLPYMSCQSTLVSEQWP